MKSIADRETLDLLLARVAKVQPTLERQWGSISVHQMLVHVADASEVVLRRKPWPMVGRKPNRVMKWLALRAPMRWPHNIKSGAEPGLLELDDGVFEADRARVVATLREVAEAGEVDLVGDHPLFGVMTRADWHRWAWLHTDHHLRQFGR
jgi:hypothetical protein